MIYHIVIASDYSEKWIPLFGPMLWRDQPAHPPGNDSSRLPSGKRRPRGGLRRALEPADAAIGGEERSDTE